MASKRRQRRKQCDGKVRHGSPAAANYAIKELHRSRGYQGPMNCYKCQFCGGWHIGHVKNSSSKIGQQGYWTWGKRGTK